MLTRNTVSSSVCYMENQEKIETKIRSIRFPLDVLELLERWAEETGQNVTQVLSTCVRTAAEDEERVTKSGMASESVLQDEEMVAGVLQIRIPTNRDSLADAITVLMRETAGRIGDRDQISALGVARARVYKTTSEYQAMKPLRDDREYPPSVYEDEGRLAKVLSDGGGAGNLGLREKGDKAR